MHGIDKLDISQKIKENMDLFKKNHIEKFKEYAMRDSLITLIHSLFMNEFAIRLGSASFPVTLGGLAEKYIDDLDYDDVFDKEIQKFQNSQNTSLDTLAYSNSHSDSTLEAKKRNFVVVKDLMDALNKENSFVQEHQELSEISPAVMSMINNPDYKNIDRIDQNTNIDNLNLVDSYSALRVNFNLPSNIKFPPIPVNLNKLTIYPLQGESLITGLEYISARNILNSALKQICDNDSKLLESLKKQFFIKVISGVMIPFKPNGYKPFFNVINELQANRRKHPKKSALERIYKDLGNMLYGKTVAGINNNRKYDARYRMMKPTTGGHLTNPIIGA
ncbi:hypothetical protein HOY80DRAFT_1116255 [Tuber brumale]|nr:hypothetical protein HOY80DRAFT_1116255 [Tuber brumale]